jgi:LacI family transcriptional regulator
VVVSKRIATRAEVAALAKVSPALVSYVINGGPRPVSAAARERILAAIDELDYRPDPAASALTGGSSRSVGVLVPTTINPYYSELVMEIETRLFERGYVALIGITNDEPDVELAYLRSFLDRRADAIIVMSSNPQHLLDASASVAVPLVLAGPALEGPGTRASEIDHAQGAARVVEHLQSWGHSVIACITGPRHDPIANARVDGWRAQQAGIGAPDSPTLVFHTEVSMDGGVRATRLALASTRLRASNLRPTALFVTSDVQAVGALFACHEAGLAVPGDISVAAIDGTQAAKFSSPVLTTLRLPLGELADDLVTHALEGGVAGRRFEGNLVIGESCGRPAQRDGRS